MGKSYSASTNTAIDNRMAVTDQGFGLSSSGSGNNTALQGHILNINGGGGQAIKGTGGASAGVNVNVLDGGVINKAFDFSAKAFDFSAFSLSAVLDSVINGQKVQQQSAQYTADTIGNAVSQAARINSAAAAAALAANKELKSEEMAAYKELKSEEMAIGKKLLIGLGVVGVTWFFWGGRNA